MAHVALTNIELTKSACCFLVENMRQTKAWNERAH